MAGSQDDKAKPFKASNKKRGNTSSTVKKPLANPKRYKASGGYGPSKRK